MDFNEEKLIIEVSKFSVLYDLQDKDYMNSKHKQNIWKKIGKEMGVDDIVCKDRWRSLRDGYNRSLKRKKTKSGDGARSIKNWKFDEQMQFLRPYFQERCTKTNIENIEPSTSANNSIQYNEDYDEVSNSPDLTNSSFSSSSTTAKEMTARKKNKAPQTQQSSVANVLQKYLESRQVPSLNPIQSTFKAMADSTEALPPDLQLKVKTKLFSIIAEAEQENLNRISTSEVAYYEEHIDSYSDDETNHTYSPHKSF